MQEFKNIDLFLAAAFSAKNKKARSVEKTIIEIICDIKYHWVSKHFQYAELKIRMRIINSNWFKFPYYKAK